MSGAPGETLHEADNWRGEQIGAILGLVDVAQLGGAKVASAELGKLSDDELSSLYLDLQAPGEIR